MSWLNQVLRSRDFLPHFDVVKQARNAASGHQVRVCNSLLLPMAGAEDLRDRPAAPAGKYVSWCATPCMGACGQGAVRRPVAMCVMSAGDAGR